MTINQCTFTHEWVLACCQYTLALVYCTQAICFCKQIVFLRVVTFDRKSYWQLVGCGNETENCKMDNKGNHLLSRWHDDAISNKLHQFYRYNYLR